MDEWYHIYLTYDSELVQDNIQLYVLDETAAASCDVELGTCFPDVTANATGLYILTK